jgi:hypothetical protein
MELTLQQLKKIALNCRSSYFGTISVNAEVMSHFLIWISLTALSYFNGSHKTQNK